MAQFTETETARKSSGVGKWLFGGALLASLIAGGYVALSGSEVIWENLPADRRDAPQSEAAAPEPAPSPAATAADSHEARGVVQAAEEATVGSRITARIEAIPYRIGASFPRGAVLVKLDCTQLRAQLNAADAAAVAYQKTYETNVELDQYKAIGTNEVAVSKANLGKARAESAAISAQLQDCAVRAPFAGTIVEEIAHRGEIAASGQPLLKLQSGGALEAELIVPSKWLTWLMPGEKFAFMVDETGEQISGEVRRVGASVDPVSKTVRITGDLVPGKRPVLPGMSGTAAFEQSKTGETPAKAGSNGATGPG